MNGSDSKIESKVMRYLKYKDCSAYFALLRIGGVGESAPGASDLLLCGWLSAHLSHRVGAHRTAPHRIGRAIEEGTGRTRPLVDHWRPVPLV